MCFRNKCLNKVIIIAIPILILLAIIGGLLGASAKDLNAVRFPLKID